LRTAMNFFPNRNSTSAICCDGYKQQVSDRSATR